MHECGAPDSFKDSEVRIPRSPLPSRKAAYVGAFGRTRRVTNWRSLLVSSAATVALFAVALLSMTSVRRLVNHASEFDTSRPTTRVTFLEAPRQPAPPPQIRSRPQDRRSRPATSKPSTIEAPPAPRPVAPTDTATKAAAPAAHLRDITIPSSPSPSATDNAPTAAIGRGSAAAPAGVTSNSSPTGELHGLAFKQRAMAGMTSRDSALAAWNEVSHDAARWQTMSEETARSIDDSKRDAYKLAQRVGTAGNSADIHVPTGNGVGGVGAAGGGLGGSIGLPLFSRGPSRAQRVKDSIIDADVRAGLARLALRVTAKRDSLRVIALRDSVRADSLRADSTRADSARRLARARRP